MAEVNVFRKKVETEKRSPRIEDLKHTLRLFFKNKLAFSGFIIALIYFAIAILDAVYPQYLGVTNANTMLSFLYGQQPQLTPPTAPTFSHGVMYIFGTTQYGIPLLPAILASLKFDMAYSLAIVAVGMSVGMILGTASGYLGGMFDEVMMRITDVFFSIPQIVLALALVYTLGDNFIFIVISFMIIWWPIYARLSRSLALSTKEMRYVEAAIASGSSKVRNIFVHILPNVLSPIFVQISLDIGIIIQLFAGLEYIGLNRGNPYLPELGILINWGQQYIVYGAWWPTVIPSIVLVIFTIGVSVMGDGLRDVLDPKLRR